MQSPKTQSNWVTPLHPLVLATNRFIHWLTPFGLDYMDHLSKSFSPLIIACDHIVLCCCIMQNSLSNYTGSLLHFTQFCNNFSLPETARIPTTRALLCIFITSHGAGHVGWGTLTGSQAWSYGTWSMVCLGWAKGVLTVWLREHP